MVSPFFGEASRISCVRIEPLSSSVDVNCTFFLASCSWFDFLALVLFSVWAVSCFFGRFSFLFESACFVMRHYRFCPELILQGCCRFFLSFAVFLLYRMAVLHWQYSTSTFMVQLMAMSFVMILRISVVRMSSIVLFLLLVLQTLLKHRCMPFSACGLDRRSFLRLVSL